MSIPLQTKAPTSAARARSLMRMQTIKRRETRYTPRHTARGICINFLKRSSPSPSLKTLLLLRALPAIFNGSVFDARALSHIRAHGAAKVKGPIVNEPRRRAHARLLKISRFKGTCLCERTHAWLDATWAR